MPKPGGGTAAGMSEVSHESLGTDIEPVEDPGIQTAFRRSLEEGERRLRRTWPALLATGFVGGADLSIGVVALLVVEHETGSHLLGSLAFTVGFIALALARSELFTENFLVPVTTVVAGRGTVPALLRLWGGTAVMNLVGGGVVVAIAMTALPHLRSTAIETGRFYPELGISRQSLALAVLGGLVITVYTWMQHNSETEVARVIAAVAASFLLVAGPLNHVIVSSVEMFAAMAAGAPFSVGQWFGAFLWAALGNLLGGLGLVTLLRLVQVGREEIETQRDHRDEPLAEDA